MTAALLGSLSYYALKAAGADDGWALAAALGVTFVVRTACIVFALRLLPGRIKD